MRATELAGLDAGGVLAAAIGERDLAGARDLAAILDARLRYRIGSLVPAAASSWSAYVPAIADSERRVFAVQITALMDARQDRIGEHAAEHALPWAVAAPGPVPEDALDRLDWQKRAASVGAWRELAGHCDPGDPIGPEPVTAAPDLRAAWQEAFAALGPAPGPMCVACPTAGCCTARHLPDRGRPGTAIRRRRTEIYASRVDGIGSLGWSAAGSFIDPMQQRGSAGPGSVR
jgi:hypothetical protein